MTCQELRVQTTKLINSITGRPFQAPNSNSCSLKYLYKLTLPTTFSLLILNLPESPYPHLVAYGSPYSSPASVKRMFRRPQRSTETDVLNVFQRNVQLVYREPKAVAWLTSRVNIFTPSKSRLRGHPDVSRWFKTTVLPRPQINLHG